VDWTISTLIVLDQSLLRYSCKVYLYPQGRHNGQLDLYGEGGKESWKKK